MTMDALKLAMQMEQDSEIFYRDLAETKRPIYGFQENF